jgi:hypothetical protein
MVVRRSTKAVAMVIRGEISVVSTIMMAVVLPSAEMEDPWVVVPEEEEMVIMAASLSRSLS